MTPLAVANSLITFDSTVCPCLSRSQPTTELKQYVSICRWEYSVGNSKILFLIHGVVESMNVKPPNMKGWMYLLKKYDYK